MHQIKRMRGVTSKAIGEIEIDQGRIYNWPVSWNPDDERFYIERADKTARATFKRFSNLVQWCKKHQAEVV